MSDLDPSAARDLCRAVFLRAGARVEDKGPVLEVELPAGSLDPLAEGVGREARDLARRFGREKIAFAFEGKDAAPGVDLVAPGGHVLRAIEDHWGARGRRTYVELPPELRVRKSSLPRALAPAKGHALSIESREEEVAHDVLLGFRVRYRGRERRDALVWVEVALRAGAPPAARVAARPSEALLRAGTFHARKHVAEEPLRAAFESARAAVEDEVRRAAAVLEAKARERVKRDASRLELFYSSAVEEQRRKRASDAVQARIEELEEERAAKLRELAEGARVAVEVEPLQLVELERPAKRLALRLSRKKGGLAATIAARVDLVSGVVTASPCPACQGDLATPRPGAAGLVLDDSGHALHSTCALVCRECGTTLCTACGASPCARGAEVLCSRCARTCEGCGDMACAAHRGACSLCKAARCTACLHACAHCRRAACERHRLAVGEGTEAWLCSECGAPCPGCGRVSEDLARCPTCGRRLCPDCLGGRQGADEACAACRARG